MLFLYPKYRKEAAFYGKNIVKELKKKLSNELISETELENLMYEYGYVPMEEDADSETILKFQCSTNGGATKSISQLLR